MAKLIVVGLGYIGLPTALMMAASGVNVVGTDFNTTVDHLLSSPEALRRAGEASSAYIRRHAGATARIYQAVYGY